MKQEKRELIMDAALKLFIEYGFHGTPTSKISKEAGVSTGTLFNYFATKEELINELYLDAKSSMGTYIKERYVEGDDLFLSMKSYWTSAIEWGIANPVKFKFKGQFYNSPFINSLSKEKGMQYFSFIFGLFMKIQEQNIVKTDNMEFLGTYVHGAFDSVANYIIDNREKITDIDEFIESSFDMFWNGIKK